MAQIFHRSTNTLSRVTIFGGLFVVAGLIGLFAILDRSSYNTGEGVVLRQPIPFSHDHHTAALGISCLYCHSSVEESAFAGIPPTATCMNCHNLIWNQSPMLAGVRESYSTGEPIRWVRVNDLPDYVFFNHGIHISKGVGCESCHGRVDRMPLIMKAESLQMEWCLDCHRNPEQHVRPLSEVYTMGWTPPSLDEGTRLVAEHAIADTPDLTSCSACHR